MTLLKKIILDATAVATVCGLLMFQSNSFAHEGEMHGAHIDAQMQKLHEMMPMYATAITKVAAALEKRDMAVVKAETVKMLATIPDLKKSKPHKNLKQLGTYRGIAAGFAGDLEKMANLANKGDLVPLKAALRKVGSRCAECHAKFR